MPAANDGQLRQWMTQIDGQQLRRLRRQVGLSQVELATRAGISMATVARLERKVRATCRGRTMARLAAALGESRDALTGMPTGSAD